MRRLLAKPHSAEVRRRALRQLEDLEVPASPERLAALRGTEVLERPAREAQAALRRLEDRAP